MGSTMVDRAWVSVFCEERNGGVAMPMTLVESVLAAVADRNRIRPGAVVFMRPRAIVREQAMVPSALHVGTRLKDMMRLRLDGPGPYVGDHPLMSAFGALGAVGLWAVQSDMDAVARGAPMWCKVPESISLHLHGTRPKWLSYGEVVAHVALILGGPLKDLFVEIDGPGWNALRRSGQLHLAQAAGDFHAAVVGLPQARALGAGPQSGAHYAARLELNLSRLQPLVMQSRDSVRQLVPLADLKGLPVDEILVGGLGELREMARLLEGRTLHPRLQVKVVPRAPWVAEQARAEGLWQQLASVGVLWPEQVPLHATGLRLGAVTLATPGVNQPKRGPGGSLFWVNPQVAAATAVTGRLAAPWEVATC